MMSLFLFRYIGFLRYRYSTFELWWRVEASLTFASRSRHKAADNPHMMLTRNQPMNVSCQLTNSDQGAIVYSPVSYPRTNRGIMCGCGKELKILATLDNREQYGFHQKSHNTTGVDYK